MKLVYPIPGLCLALLLLGASHDAHGGPYGIYGDPPPGPPGAGPPPGSTPTTPGTTFPRRRGFEPAGWALWWELNHASLLDLPGRREARFTSGDCEDWLLRTGQDPREAERERNARQVREVIVPALTRALAHDGANPDLAAACLIALAKTGVEEVEPILVRHLSHPAPEVTAHAALALGILGRPGAHEPLVDLLANNPQGQRLTLRPIVPLEARVHAAYALGLLAGHTSDRAIQARMSRALLHEFRDLGGGCFDLRIACLIAAGMVPTTSIEELLTILVDPRQPGLVRAHLPLAVTSLLERKPDAREQVVAAFLAQLNHPTPENALIRLGILKAFARIGDADADRLDREIRTALFREHDRFHGRSARGQALIALASIAGRPGTGPEPGGGISEIQAFLVGRLSDPKPEVSAWNGIALGLLGRDWPAGDARRQEVRTALVEGLEKFDWPDTQTGFALGLGLLEHEEAAAPLARTFATTKEDRARACLATALGMVGEHAHVPEVEKLLQLDTIDPVVRWQASTALALVGDKEVVPRLLALLTTAPSDFPIDGVARALRGIGDRRAVEPLVQLLVREDGKLAEQVGAAVALGHLADREAFTWRTMLAAHVNQGATTAALFDFEAGRGILLIP